VLLQLANPKALLFFTALLPQFIAPSASITPQILILGMTSILLEFLVLSTYGAPASRASAMVRSARSTNYIRKAGGILLIGAGAGIAAVRAP
jgi:homoserine/homoserine lactone efflux protein